MPTMVIIVEEEGLSLEQFNPDKGVLGLMDDVMSVRVREIQICWQVSV